MKTLLALLLSASTCMAAPGIPYFAKTSIASTPSVPTHDLFFWANPQTGNVFKSQYGTNAVAVNGDPVGALRDYSPHGYLATNSSADGQTAVVWRPSSHGDTNPVISVADYGTSTRLASSFSTISNSQIWGFLVSYPDTSGGFGGIPNCPIASADSVTFFKLTPGDTYLQNNSADAVFVVPVDVWSLISFKIEYFAPAVKSIVIRTNGVVAADVTNSAFSPYFGSGLCLLGTIGSFPRFRGDIAELLLYEGPLTSNEVYTVENYLRRHPFPYAGP